jgi:hypothetical protein
MSLSQKMKIWQQPAGLFDHTLQASGFRLFETKPFIPTLELFT